MSKYSNEIMSKHKENLLEMYSRIDYIDIVLSRENRLNLNSFLNFVKSFRNKTNNIEFELRIQNISEEQFKKTKREIEKDEYFLSKKKLISNSVILSNNIRIETFENKKKYQKKDEIKKFKFILNNTPIKLSLSSENDINPSNITDKRNLLTRTKNRMTYEFQHFNIDLTEVNTIDNIKNTNYNSFEIEIEFLTFDINENIIEDIIRYIFNIMFPKKYSFIDNETEKSVRIEYNKLFPNIRNTRPNFIFENKPKNFKLKDIENFNHSITNKLNGVNFFLYYSYRKDGLYLINHSTIEYINYDITEYLTGDFLIQGELYFDESIGRHIFYIFDVLFIENESLLQLNHPKRLERLNKSLFRLIDDIIYKSKKAILMKIKKFYGLSNNESNHYNNLINCEYSLEKDINGNIDMEINDGFIFTPLNMPYINKETYKYKFPETMTIDFSVQLHSQNDNINLYKLFVYDEKNQLIEFNFNNKTYYLQCDISSNDICKDIKNNNIVECFFTKKNFFIPYRIRHDKLMPNFYRVAQDVFNDILNPITLKDLEVGFKNKFSPKQNEIENKEKSMENINITDVTLKVNMNSIIECVLYSVSPEYREYNETNVNVKNIMLNKTLEYFENNSDKLNDIENLAKSFNIKIFILENKNDMYFILNKSSNKNKNKLYIVKNKQNNYTILGYTIKQYNIFIY